jgi:type I restriction enzyme S subunit
MLRSKRHSDDYNFIETEIGRIPRDWDLSKLSDIAQVIVSNVDKIFEGNESPVFLCNYLDVYQNEYITHNLNFMRGSASKAEIVKFSLSHGDVLITKDSETAEDIASAAVVADTIPNLLCGYHLAILRPKKDRVDSFYLAKMLQHNRVHNQFVSKANGVTRYGLTLSVINNAAIPVPPLVEQFEISQILSTWDRAIERVQRLIEAKQRHKKGLMQGLFTGKLRFPEFGKPVSNKVIPEDWTQFKLSQAAKIINGGTPSRNVPEYWGGNIPWIAVGDFSEVDRFISDTKEKITELGFRESSTNLLKTGELIISARGTVGAVAQLTKPMAFNQTSYGLRADTKFALNDFLFYLLRQFNHKITEISHGAIFDTITRDTFDYIELPFPNLHEQRKIADLLGKMDNQIDHLKKHLEKLKQQKKGLMQKLLTGEIRVKVD